MSEIIAWDQGSDLQSAAEEVVQMWMDSTVHRHEILSKTHNYLGAGVATDGHTIKWTVISITGRDRTDPTARIGSVALEGGEATVRWTGHDPWLVVNTAGIRDYDLARRQPGGAWKTIRDDTTRVSTDVCGARGDAVPGTSPGQGGQYRNVVDTRDGDRADQLTPHVCEHRPDALGRVDSRA